MKAILTRLFNHESLDRDEARRLMLGITAGQYPDTQVAALLAAYRMRDVSIDELLGFRL